jgi:hypothetical protein
MKTEKVISTVEDKRLTGFNFQKGGYDISSSPIWDECYHPTDDLPDKELFGYFIKFDGLKPVQCTKFEKL